MASRLFVVLAVAVFALSSAASQSETIVSTAKSMVGKYRYSWGGGNDAGATKGIKMQEDPYCDDTQVVGFDCSGLAKYSVFQGTGISMVHRAQVQYTNCPNLVSYDNRKPGDLLFYGSSTTSIYHVTIYIGDDKMVEAPSHFPNCTGKFVQQGSVRSSNLIGSVCRMWTEEPQSSSESESTSGSKTNSETKGSQSMGIDVLPSIFLVVLSSVACSIFLLIL